MIDLGGIEIVGGLGIALAVSGAAAFLVIKAGDAIGRQIDECFGIGGHWAHERRSYDHAADGDEAVSHGERDGAETAGLTSGKARSSAGAVRNG